MFCPSCNAPNRDDAKFCKGCGRPLRAEPVGVQGDVTTRPVPSTPPVAQASASAARPEQESSDVQVQVPAAPVQEPQEDVSLAPTLILTPEKMLAYHSRRWQEELERETGSKGSGQSAPGSTIDSADMPTIISAPQTQEPDIEDMPTLLINNQPYANHEQGTPPPPPPPEVTGVSPTSGGSDQQAFAAQAPQAAQTGQAGDEDFNTVPVEITPAEEKSEVMQPSTDQPEEGTKGTTGAAETTEKAKTEQAAPASDFATLAVGATVEGRYEITQVVNETPQEHVYQVIDRQGYQHCWNCGSEENGEGDEFCIDCGASLLNVPYIMHEYAAQNGAGATEDSETANVLQGAIINTFIEQGHTYVIEQPQVAQSSFPNGVQLLAACNSDAGDVRRSEPNEDSTLVLLLQRVHESLAAPAGVFIVADGLGGHDNGQVASRMAINIIAERMVRELLSAPLVAEKEGTESKPFDEDALVELLHSAIEDANQTLCQKNQQAKTDMGSTLTGFMVVGEHAYVVNVGDSRTYMLRGKQIYQLTTDHSLVGQLVAGGLIEPDEVYTHPQRSQIYRSLGDKPNVQIDIFKQQLHPGDVLLSCSDGLWEMVRNPQIESILNNAPDPQTACAQLIEAANTNGGEDNVSAVLVSVR